MITRCNEGEKPVINCFDKSLTCKIGWQSIKCKTLTHCQGCTANCYETLQMNAPVKITCEIVIWSSVSSICLFGVAFKCVMCFYFFYFFFIIEFWWKHTKFSIKINLVFFLCLCVSQINGNGDKSMGHNPQSDSSHVPFSDEFFGKIE